MSSAAASVRRAFPAAAEATKSASSGADVSAAAVDPNRTLHEAPRNRDPRRRSRPRASEEAPSSTSAAGSAPPFLFLSSRGEPLVRSVPSERSSGRSSPLPSASDASSARASDVSAARSVCHAPARRPSLWLKNAATDEAARRGRRMARRSPGSSGRTASEGSEAVSEPPEALRDARGASSRGGPGSPRSDRSGASKTGAKSNEGSVSALEVSQDPSASGTFRSRDDSVASPRQPS